MCKLYILIFIVMTIASEISRLQTAKANIKTAVWNKWVTVPDSAKLDTYNTYINNIDVWDKVYYSWYYTDNSSLNKWPCNTWYHIPTVIETASLWSMLKSMKLTSTTTLSNCLKEPVALSWVGYYLSWASWDPITQYWPYWWVCERYAYVAYRVRDNQNKIMDNYKDAVQIRPFKNEPINPLIWDWTNTLKSWRSWIQNPSWIKWVAYNSSLWLISISDNWYIRITIADKNVWATTVWTSWATESESNRWKCFQRWNNYWFPFSWATSKSTTRVTMSSYTPGNYSNSTFIYTSNRSQTRWNWNYIDPVLKLRWDRDSYNNSYEIISTGWEIFSMIPKSYDEIKLMCETEWWNIPNTLALLNKHKFSYIWQFNKEWKLQRPSNTYTIWYKMTYISWIESGNKKLYIYEYTDSNPEFRFSS